MAGLPMIHLRSLLVGTMLPSGTALPNIPMIIGNQAQVDQKFGIGSELSRLSSSALWQLATATKRAP